MMFPRRIYQIWGIFSFVAPFIVMYPLFHLAAKRENWHKYASRLNKFWAQAFFTLAFIPYQVEYRFRPPRDAVYVYCANHSSWLDIPSMGLIVRGDFVFIGKEALTKIPLFGSMFAKLHIPINRESRLSSYRAWKQSVEAIEKRQSVVTFPEGGIRGRAPQLNAFKDGPFRLAIEKQVPIIPVTILYNWVILPNDKKFLPRWHPGKAIVHEPINTQSCSLADLNSLKHQTYAVIEQEIQRRYPTKTEKIPQIK